MSTILHTTVEPTKVAASLFQAEQKYLTARAERVGLSSDQPEFDTAVDREYYAGRALLDAIWEEST